MLPEKLITIAQVDYVSVAADLRMLENMNTVNIGLLCEGATHPGEKDYKELEDQKRSSIAEQIWRGTGSATSTTSGRIPLEMFTSTKAKPSR